MTSTLLVIDSNDDTEMNQLDGYWRNLLGMQVADHVLKAYRHRTKGCEAFGAWNDTVFYASSWRSEIVRQ